MIPAFTLIQMVVTPTATPADDKPRGYGLKLAEIRPLGFSLYSYMNPAGLALLPDTFDKSMELMRNLLSKPLSIEKQLNATCVAFFGTADSKAFLAENTDGWMRLTCTEGAVMEGLQEMDVCVVGLILFNSCNILFIIRPITTKQKDLLSYTNAGTDLGYAIFVTDLAAAAGALRVLVIRDPNYSRDPARSEFRGIPLIDTEQLLEFIDTEVSPGDDTNIQYDLPFKVCLVLHMKAPKTN